MKRLTKLTLTILLSAIVIFSYSQEDKKKTRAEKKAEKEADLSKLDAKLDEILSDDSDLNL